MLFQELALNLGRLKDRAEPHGKVVLSVFFLVCTLVNKKIIPFVFALNQGNPLAFGSCNHNDGTKGEITSIITHPPPSSNVYAEMLQTKIRDKISNQVTQAGVEDPKRFLRIWILI
jgi:hypothetical protein